MIGLSHVALGGALMACAAGFGGYLHGIGVGEAREQAAQKRADDAVAKQTAKLQAEIDATDQESQGVEYARQSAVREIYHETQKIVDRPVYRNLCVDADGVGLLDRAVATANGESLVAPAGTARVVAAGPAD